MPILKSKLVVKSIEALHDEFFQCLILQAPLPPHPHLYTQPMRLESRKHAQRSVDKGKPKTLSDCNIMARIDHLLKKLDEEECVTIAQPQSNKLRPSDENVIDTVRDTVTTNDKTVDNSLNLEKPARSVEAARSVQVQHWTKPQTEWRKYAVTR